MDANITEAGGEACSSSENTQKRIYFGVVWMR